MKSSGIVLLVCIIWFFAAEGVYLISVTTDRELTLLGKFVALPMLLLIWGFKTASKAMDKLFFKAGKGDVQ